MRMIPLRPVGPAYLCRSYNVGPTGLRRICNRLVAIKMSSLTALKAELSLLIAPPLLLAVRIFLPDSELPSTLSAILRSSFLQLSLFPRVIRTALRNLRQIRFSPLNRNPIKLTQKEN